MYIEIGLYFIKYRKLDRILIFLTCFSEYMNTSVILVMFELILFRSKNQKDSTWNLPLALEEKIFGNVDERTTIDGRRRPPLDSDDLSMQRSNNRMWTKTELTDRLTDNINLYQLSDIFLLRTNLTLVHPCVIVLDIFDKQVPFPFVGYMMKLETIIGHIGQFADGEWVWFRGFPPNHLEDEGLLIQLCCGMFRAKKRY